MSIKYYQLAKDEELPEEFCAVRDMGGEPSEYVFYVPESNVAKLRKLIRRMRDHIKDSCDICDEYYCSSWDEDNECCVFDTYMRELGEVDE